MSRATWRDAEQLTVEIEGLQKHKVIELARRLRPGITPEDIRNPHDFPELGDPDWQFEDGVLTGIQTVLSAIRARIRGSVGGGEGEHERENGGEGEHERENGGDS